MTFGNAIKQLVDGKAAKIPSWGGYCKRTDSSVDAYDKDRTTGYSVNAKVIYMGSCYQCKTAIPSGSAAGNFDPSKWDRLYTVPHTLTFKNRSGTEYVSTATVTTGAVSYGTFSPSLSLDSELFNSMLSDEWIVGNTADFELARSGSGTW